MKKDNFDFQPCQFGYFIIIATLYWWQPTQNCLHVNDNTLIHHLVLNLPYILMVTLPQAHQYVGKA